MARIVRGEVLSIKNQEYVLAARTLGANTWHLIKRHIVPNALGAILVTMTLTIPTAIFTESFLSYLGLGVPASDSKLGNNGIRRKQSVNIRTMAINFPCIIYFINNICI